MLRRRALTFLSHVGQETRTLCFHSSCSLFLILKKRNRKIKVYLEKPCLLWENRKSKRTCKVVEPKTEGKGESDFPRSLAVFFKAKLQQEGSCDLKQGLKWRIQSRLYPCADPLAMVMTCCVGSSGFTWNGEREKLSMIDVPYEGQTAKSLTCWLSR